MYLLQGKSEIKIYIWRGTFSTTLKRVYFLSLLFITIVAQAKKYASQHVSISEYRITDRFVTWNPTLNHALSVDLPVNLISDKVSAVRRKYWRNYLSLKPIVVGFTCYILRLNILSGQQRGQLQSLFLSGMGKFCLTDRNNCDSNPCLNNGTCNEHANGFNCSCPLGFAGERCQDGKNQSRSMYKIRANVQVIWYVLRAKPFNFQ